MDLDNIVISYSDRYAQILKSNLETIKAFISSETRDLTVGDKVEIYQQLSDFYIKKILPRTNQLYRVLGKKKKSIASNLDHVFIVTAPEPLFNCSVIDRTILLCESENIATSIIINKTDLDYKTLKNYINCYQAMDYQVLFTVANYDFPNIKDFETMLLNSNYKNIALTGVSGVGKSSLINLLLNINNIQTADISRKTGQGRQTTSKVKAYPYKLKSNKHMLLVDVPGIHNFGISHFDKKEVASRFRDFKKYAINCEYSDCQHLEEPNCAVKQAIELKKIALSRYNSYLGIIEEINKYKKY